MFYIFVMVYVLWLADFINKVKLHKISIKEVTKVFTFINVSIALSAWLAGFFVVDLSSASTIYYGGFGTNTLSLFEPYQWSYLLKNIYIATGNWEDINFLGLGNIFLLCLALFKFHELKASFIACRQKYSFLLVAVIFMAVFAFTNKVGIGNFHFTIPAPDFLLRIFGILRNSGRFLWPAYYCFVIFIIYVVAKGYPKNKLIFIFITAAIIQIVDTSSGWLAIRNHLKSQSTKIDAITSNVNKLTDPLWTAFSGRYQKILLMPLRDDHPQYFGWGEVVNWPLFSSYALKNHMSTNSIYFARANSSAINQTNTLNELMIANAKYDDQALYIISDAKVLPVLLTLDSSRDALMRLNEINVLAPKWNQCQACPKASSDQFFTFNIPEVNNGIPIKFGKVGDGPKFLLDVGKYQQTAVGWSYPEEWGVWANGNKARIVLPLPKEGAKFLDIALRVFISKNHLSQIAFVRINDEKPYKLVLTKDQDSVRIPLPASGPRKYVEIEFNFANAISPKELSNGSDDRKLSIGIEQITFQK